MTFNLNVFLSDFPGKCITNHQITKIRLRVIVKKIKIDTINHRQTLKYKK